MPTTVLLENKTISYENAREVIEGDIQLIRTRAWTPGLFDQSTVALVDEEGGLKNLPRNYVASKILGVEVVGTVILLVDEASQEGWTWANSSTDEEYND